MMSSFARRIVWKRDTSEVSVELGDVLGICGVSEALPLLYYYQACISALTRAALFNFCAYIRVSD